MIFKENKMSRLDENITAMNGSAQMGKGAELI